MRRAFVSITTENYHYLSLCLGDSIKRFSKYPLHIFCINYDPRKKGLETPKGIVFHTIEYNIDGEDSLDQFVEVDSGNFYVNRKNNRSFQIMTRKSEACLRVLDMGYDECCFIDGDSIACPNVDTIFDNCVSIKGIPLMTKGPHDFVMIYDEDGTVRGNPFENSWPDADLTLTLEYPLMEFLQVPLSMRGEYRTGNLFIFNQSCRDFLKTLEEFLNVIWKLVDVYHYSPFQDEGIMNVLVWKFGGSGLPMSYINIEGIHTVEHFFNSENSQEGIIGDFYRIPHDKSDIKVLHGEKRKQEIEKIIEYLENLKKLGYYSND